MCKTHLKKTLLTCQKCQKKTHWHPRWQQTLKCTYELSRFEKYYVDVITLTDSKRVVTMFPFIKLDGSTL